MDALRDDQWERLKEYVPGGRKGKTGAAHGQPPVLNALLWMARSGARWRDLPEQFGNYETVKRRYYRWIRWAFWTASWPRWRAKPIWSG